MSLWVRWSWRDLRRRWVQVLAIALIIAFGTGTYAALMSTSAWRTESNDASFAMLHVHDVRVALNDGSTVAEGTLVRLVGDIPHADALTGIRERLVVPTQVAGPGGLLVPGEIVGSAIGPGTGVDAVSVAGGRPLVNTDDGLAVVVLEQKFATKNHLGTHGDLTVSGQTPVRYVGIGQSPEYFLISGHQGGLPFLSEKTFGVLFTSLHSSQRIAGVGSRVNDLVVTTTRGSTEVVRDEIEKAISSSAAPISATVSTRGDIDSYRVLYDDIKGDEQFWQIIAFLVFAGAAFAAFNLTSRVVEAQRREIGIGMALGASPRALAVRPLLFGAQVALIGVAFGLGIGWLVGIPLRNVFVDIAPLPVWRFPFQPATFARAAIFGFALPFVAVAYPVWRAVRMQPADALRVGSLAARDGKLTGFFRHLPLPGRRYVQIPFRNVVRTPRRTFLTTMGIAAAITTLVTTMGFLDSFTATLDRSETELLHAAPDRVAVSLQNLQPLGGDVVDAVRRLPAVGSVEPALLVATTARHGGATVDLLTEVLPPTASWTPTIVEGSAKGGLVLANKAASDLHVGVGDNVTLEHPQMTPSGLQTVTSQVPVAGIHPDPMRVFAYLDATIAARYGLTGVTNLLTVTPAPGTSTDAVRRALLGLPQVASAQAVGTTMRGLRDSLREYLGILRVATAITLLLALLIAFNSASIGMDERLRDHATMLAFGLPTTTVLAMAIAESAVIGVAASALGVAGGHYLLRWLTATTIAQVIPEIGVIPSISIATLNTALILGVLTVAVAPVFTARRLRHLDVPSTLRVIE